MLALSEPELEKELEIFKQDMAKQVEKKAKIFES